MKKKYVILPVLLLSVIAAIGIAVAFSSSRSSTVKQAAPEPTPQAAVEPKPVNMRASFVIFANGGIRIFSDSKYHNQSPDAYITADETNIIKVKKEGVTWQQFFDSLPAPMKVTSECLYTGTGQAFCNTSTKTLKFYRNGKLETNLLPQTIQDGDKLLLSYGSSNADVSAELSRVPSP